MSVLDANVTPVVGLFESAFAMQEMETKKDGGSTKRLGFASCNAQKIKMGRHSSMQL
jgi:hypothetical protein